MNPTRRDEPGTFGVIYAGWANHHGHLLRALVSLTAAELALRAAPHLRSIGELFNHIAAGRARWFHYALNEGSAATAPLLTRDAPDTPPLSATELVAGLENTWLEIEAAIARWTPEEWARPFTMDVNGQERTITRQWVIWHLIEHDVHHGGELAFTLGMHGLPSLPL